MMYSAHIHTLRLHGPPRTTHPVRCLQSEKKLRKCKGVTPSFCADRCVVAVPYAVKFKARLDASIDGLIARLPCAALSIVRIVAHARKSLHVADS